MSSHQTLSKRENPFSNVQDQQFSGKGNPSSPIRLSTSTDLREIAVEPGAGFWDLNGYMRVVKRIEDGSILFDELKAMMIERAKIERKFASALHKHASKWRSKLLNRSENVEAHKDTVHDAWVALYKDADDVAETHLQTENKIITEIVDGIVKFKKTHYAKRTFGGIKETKVAMDNYSRASTPWLKLCLDQEQLKGEFHKFTRHLTETKSRLAAAKCFITKQSEQHTNALIYKIKGLEKKVTFARTRYTKKLEECEQYSLKYQRNMKAIFQKCQDSEEQRLIFFKEILNSANKIMGLSRGYLPSTKGKGGFSDSIAAISPEIDLNRFSERCGVYLAMPEPPGFEQYRAPMVENEKYFKPDSEERLHGVYFMKHGKKRKVKRFFVLDKKKRQLLYFSRFKEGVPHHHKGAIDLCNVKTIKLRSNNLMIKTPIRELKLSSKDDTEVECWAEMISNTTGIKITKMEDVDVKSFAEKTPGLNVVSSDSESDEEDDADIINNETDKEDESIVEFKEGEDEPIKESEEFKDEFCKNLSLSEENKLKAENNRGPPPPVPPRKALNCVDSSSTDKKLELDPVESVYDSENKVQTLGSTEMVDDNVLEDKDDDNGDISFQCQGVQYHTNVVKNDANTCKNDIMDAHRQNRETQNLVREHIISDLPKDFNQDSLDKDDDSSEWGSETNSDSDE